jgi:hypothetical protein
MKDIYSLNLKKVELLILYLLILLLPSQLAYHFWPDWSFVFGIRVDYLSPTVYLTDILIVGLLFIWFIRVKVFPKFIFVLVLFAIINSYFSISPIASITKWAKVLELSLFAFYVSKNKSYFQGRNFLVVLSISLAAFSLIGILQFINGGTLGGALYYLGERSFNLSTPGIALENIMGREYLRPYSTFPHPNSLAGYFSVFLVLYPNLLKVPFFLSGLVVLISGSLSAYLGIVGTLLFKNLSRVFLVSVVVISLILPIVSIGGGGEVVEERMILAKLAGEIISSRFFVGSGLNTFVYNNSLMQPVHNIFLLVFSELGIFGLLGFCWLFFKGFARLPKVFVFILLTGFFDHYWLTLQQNMVLLALVFGLVF